ncbi:Thioredoxin [Caenispirillum salinarum AK4]|uniref:Thioredoxin n=1 Tax=Caenispirillum salinarum AK4 TaxID=1238182 RepID=K9HW31_9PROT|nr:thioredoxin TrxC [Caenispirillum salinarum]EKV32436.1 Thioredoxin [Caenispirillum salinarum AK4]
MSQIACPQCLATNRVPEDKPAEKARCGSCKAALFDGHPVEADEKSFDTLVNRTDIPVVVDFWAPWCGPCRMMAPAYEQAAAHLEPEVRLLKVDTQANPGLAARFGIRSIPTLAVFKDGKEVTRQAGAMPGPQLIRWIESVTAYA